MKVHQLKTHHRPYLALATGTKLFEWRKNDRDFQVDDMLILMRFDPDSATYVDGEYLVRWVTYVLRGPDFGVPEGFCVMSLTDQKP